MAPLVDARSQADGSAASLDAAAKAAFAAGRHEEAAALFGQLLLTGPLEPHLVLSNRSAAWARLGKWAEAEGDARLAMASAPPSFVKAPYRLACALQGCGRLDEARSRGSGQALRSVRLHLKPQPRTVVLTAHLATAQPQLRRHADPNQASTVCTAALEHAPGSEQANPNPNPDPNPDPNPNPNPSPNPSPSPNPNPDPDPDPDPNPNGEQLLALLRSCTPSAAHAAEPGAATATGTPTLTAHPYRRAPLGCSPHAAEPHADTSTPASTSGGGLGDAGSGPAVNGSAAAVQNGSTAASGLVSAAASEEGAAAAGAEEEEALPLEGGSYTAFCQATGNRLFAVREWGGAVAW